MQDLILYCYVKQTFANDLNRSRFKLYNLPKVELDVSGRMSSGFWPPALCTVHENGRPLTQRYLLAWW